MPQYIYFYLLFFVIHSSILSAQTVNTWLPNVNISDDLIHGPDGFIYGSDFDGTTVYKVATDGTVTPFATGITNPNGLAFDDDQNLYVVGWGEGKIWKVDTSGAKVEFASGLGNPSGLIRMLNQDTLLVTISNQNRIDKVSLDGVVLPYITDSQLNAPVGLDYNDNGELIIANFSNNRIFKAEADGSLTLIVNLPVSPAVIGFIACVEEYIYATMFSAHKIYRTDYEGNFFLVAGSTVGSVDGDAATAKFNNPNGILSSITGDSVYISDYSTGSVRVITDLDLVNGIEDVLPVVLGDFTISPNPAVENISIAFSIQESLSGLNWELLDASGKIVFTKKWTEQLPAGKVKLDIELPQFLNSGTYFYRLNDEGQVLGGGAVQLLK